jgi:hypothetical protein
LILIAPRLPQIEHLALTSGSSNTVLPINVLPGRCEHLKSLALSSLNDIPESALIDLLNTVPLLEEISLHTTLGPCISNEILCTLGKVCPRLRRASFICLNVGGLTVEGFHALAQGCRALEKVDAWKRVGRIAKAAGIPVCRIQSTRWRGAYESAYDWEE